jgi:hypothetical protein
MKKKLVASLAAAMVLGVAGTSFAAANPFSDVPAKHWSYGAVTQLENAGILEGYGDGTFRGDKTISRYEMAIIVAKAMSKIDKADAADKALIEKLEAEYSAELKGLGAKYDKLDKRVDNVMLSGFVRAKYDSDRLDGKNANGGNKHFYMDLQGQMKVNDNWDAHFESETNKQYTNSTWSNAATGYDTENDGTFQRIWATGKVGKVGVTVGQKWWGYASNVLYGHAADGIQLDFPVSSNFTASVFDLRPSQGPLIGHALADSSDTSLYGVNLNAALSKATNLTVVVGGNHETGSFLDDSDKDHPDKWKTYPETGVTRWGAIDLSAKFGSDFKITGTYAKTNADSFNKSQELRLDYKATDLQTPGSYDIYARYIKFEKYGDLSHDDEWDSLRADTKGWVLGVDYVLGRNVQWTTLYSDQKNGISDASTESKRKLIRSEVDFHF